PPSGQGNGGLAAAVLRVHIRPAFEQQADDIGMPAPNRAVERGHPRRVASAYVPQRRLRIPVQQSPNAFQVSGEGQIMDGGRTNGLRVVSTLAFAQEELRRVLEGRAPVPATDRKKRQQSARQ